MTRPVARRCPPLPPAVVDGATAPATRTPDAELLDRLESALSGLPAVERAVVFAAYGYGESLDQLGVELEMRSCDVDSLARSALQLLRGALADAELDERTVFGSLDRQGIRHRGQHPAS